MFGGYFIQYKFIIPSQMKHSSYTYQKIFRALYGYTQQVTKSNGKTYTYHRKGILSDIPYLRPGKNCVVIPSEPKEYLSKLIDFFKTGRNPTHRWHAKGDWKAVYYMDEKDLDEDLVVRSVEQLLERTFVSAEQGHGRLQEELNTVLEAAANNMEYSAATKEAILTECRRISGLSWVKSSATKSKKIKDFNVRYSKLRNL